MKKVALALLLLVLLVGISYLTALRSQSRLKQRYEQGREEGTKAAAKATSRADSLAQALESSTGRYKDSLSAARTQYAAATDSLQSLLERKDSTISSLKQKPKTTKATQSSSKAGSSKSNHAQILDYYKRKLAQMPKDLSEYERKVALNELRDETARKFSITVGELDRIRQNDSTKD